MYFKNGRRTWIPVVIQNLRRTYMDNRKPYTKLVWYDICKECFPEYGAVIMGEDYQSAANYVGDTAELDYLTKKGSGDGSCLILELR